MLPKEIDWEKEFKTDNWDYTTREALVDKYGVYDDEYNLSGVEDFVGHPWCGEPFLFGPKKLKYREVLKLYWDYSIIVVFNNNDKNYYLVAQYPNVFILEGKENQYWIVNKTTNIKHRIKMRLDGGA